MNIWLLVFCLVFAYVLLAMYRRAHSQVLNARRLLLDDCRCLLQNPVLSVDPAGFAKMEGHYSGYGVSFTLEPDNVVMRKLPSLWLHVSVSGKAIDGLGTLDILARPQNVEFYSPAWHWNGGVVGLPGWPQHANYSTKDHPPDLSRMDAVVQAVFTDERSKELLVTPQRVRVTYQAKQADRGEYLLMRSARFDAEPISSDLVRKLLDRALELRLSLEGPVTV